VHIDAREEEVATGKLSVHTAVERVLERLEYEVKPSK